jgi:enamine deaminase RidA (YjgF/YER057c/UK114 family)
MAHASATPHGVQKNFAMHPIETGAASFSAACAKVSFRFWRSASMSAESRLRELGLTLPEPPASGGNYVSAKRVGAMVYLAGAISTDANGVITGTAGANRTIEDGYAGARACALSQLAVLRRELGTLNAVKSIVAVNGYVNAVPGFADSPKVINGASDLFVEIFGESGRHVRAAIGVSALPGNALVELQMSVEVSD